MIFETECPSCKSKDTRSVHYFSVMGSDQGDDLHQCRICKYVWVD